MFWYYLWSSSLSSLSCTMLGLCIIRYGIQLDKKGFKVSGLLSTVVLIVVCLSMMWMSWNHLTISIIGGKSSWFRYLHLLFSSENVPSFSSLFFSSIQYKLKLTDKFKWYIYWSMKLVRRPSSIWWFKLIRVSFSASRKI